MKVTPLSKPIKYELLRFILKGIESVFAHRGEGHWTPVCFILKGIESYDPDHFFHLYDTSCVSSSKELKETGPPCVVFAILQVSSSKELKDQFRYYIPSVELLVSSSKELKAVFLECGMYRRLYRVSSSKELKGTTRRIFSHIRHPFVSSSKELKA